VARTDGQPLEPKKTAKRRASKRANPEKNREADVFEPAPRQERLAARDHDAADGRVPSGRRTTVPPAPNKRMLAIADEAGWDAARIEAEAAKFVKHNRAFGSMWVDWAEPWQRWIANAPTFERRQKMTRCTSGTSMADKIPSTM
jgi:hypothetical protein